MESTVAQSLREAQETAGPVIITTDTIRAAGHLIKHRSGPLEDASCTLDIPALAEPMKATIETGEALPFLD